MEHKRIEQCFLRNADGSYTEITYESLLRLKDYRSRFFIFCENSLLEAPEDVYREFQRAKRRERYLLTEQQRIGHLPMDEELLADLTCVEDDAVAEVMRGHLFALLRNLPAKDFSLIYALYFEGKSEAEIGSSLGITQQAVSLRKIRVLERLKKYF